MILQGDCRTVLAGLDAESVQMVCTSPPYWGLRDYGVDGQLGLEATPDEYVARMVDVFREVRRVLRKDGVLWLNLGDSYATGGGAVGRCPGGGEQGERFLRAGMVNTQPNRMPLPGLKPKDLIGIPWRVAFALQADGWWLRSDIIWSKPNPMPESVTDRPTKAHEYLFLLTKAERYFYDHKAIREPAKAVSLARISQANFDKQHGGPKDYANGVNANRSMRATLENWSDKQRGHGRRHEAFNGRWDLMSKDEQQELGCNKRTVWEIATAPFAEAHFATFPEALVKPCILAGSRIGDTVLDPFAGSGTVGVVAKSFGREFLGVELNPTYVAMAERRIAAQNPALPFEATA
jgi:DNA modification methylase